MAARNFALIVGGKVDNIIWLDPDQTDPVTFGPLIGGELIDLLDRESEGWAIGGTYANGTYTAPPRPPEPELPPVDPNAPPPPPTLEERITKLESQVAQLLAELGEPETPADPEPEPEPETPAGEGEGS